jgi:DNA modification methylase
MDIKQVKVADLVPYIRNAKKHDKAQIDNVAKSIQEFGIVQPIVVDKDNNIIIGHCRALACKQLNLEEVPVVKLEDLTPEEANKLRLLDNKLNESGWDFDLLAEDIPTLDFTDYELDWELPEIEADETEQTEIQEDTPPEDVETRCKLGDIWKLGEHRLICGDSTDVSVIDALMDGKKADMVFTDPPYGMKKESEGVLNDNLNYDDLLDFNRQWIPLSLGVLKDTGCWYCWGIDEPLMDIYSNILKPMKKANEIVIRNYITWAKHSAFGINSHLQLSYPKETEKCWFIMKGMDWNNNNAEFFNTKFERILDYLQGEANKAGIQPKDIHRVCGVQMYSHWFSKSQFSILSREHYQQLQNAYPGCFLKPYDDLRKMLGTSNDPTAELKPYFDAKSYESFGDIGLTDVWRFPVTSNKEREGLGHATPKPIALCSRAIHASSREEEIVLDVFGGSGSTMIACEQLNRKCYMCELDEHYCDVIIQRWENFTGRKAELINE